MIETGREVERAQRTRGFVFGEQRPFAQCHAPTLVPTNDGRLVVAWFAGSFEGAPDVAIWASEASQIDLDAHGQPPSTPFAPPRRVAKIARVAHWNPVLYRAADGLALQFKVGARIRSWRTFLAISRDEGRTFAPPTPLCVADDVSGGTRAESRGPGSGWARARREGHRSGRGAVRAKPIRLGSGDWLAGASSERFRRWDAYFDRSPNGVDGWRATDDVARSSASAGGKGFIQPTLWESQPGRVHALLRATDGRLHRCDSSDDGRNWSPAYPTGLPNNNSAIDVARLPDGTLALACNPVAGSGAPRTPLSLLFSRDEGASWPWRLDVESGPGEFSYPALVASGDGLLLCYTWNRRRIAWLRLGSVTALLAQA